MPFPRRASHGVFCLVWLSPKHGCEMRNYTFYIPLYFLIISLVTALYPFNTTKYMARGGFMTHNPWIFYLIGDSLKETVCQAMLDPTPLNISVKYNWMLLTLKLIGSWDFMDKLIWDHGTFWLCDQHGSSQKYAPWGSNVSHGPYLFTLENAFQKCPHCD